MNVNNCESSSSTPVYGIGVVHAVIWSEDFIEVRSLFQLANKSGAVVAAPVVPIGVMWVQNGATLTTWVVWFTWVPVVEVVRAGSISPCEVLGTDDCVVVTDPDLSTILSGQIVNCVLISLRVDRSKVASKTYAVVFAFLPGDISKGGDELESTVGDFLCTSDCIFGFLFFNFENLI